MLTVYTYRIPKPPNCLDVSGLLLDELKESITAIVNHQKRCTVWLGYLDGWMLTPMEEVILRKLLRNFDCIVISKYPLSFSQAWKNEIVSVYNDSLNGLSNINDNGSALHNGCPPGNEQVSGDTSADRQDNQNRKTGRAKKGLKQTRLNQTPSETSTS